MCYLPSILAGLYLLFMVYLCFSVTYKPSSVKISLGSTSNGSGAKQGGEVKNCCRRIEHLELWGDAVNWGSDLKGEFSASAARLARTWVELRIGLFGAILGCSVRINKLVALDSCWLKKQKDILNPDKRDSGGVMWTSGLIFGEGEGIVGLETGYGTLHVKLLSDCAPYSVAYTLELLALRHCAGGQFIVQKAEGPIGMHMEITLKITGLFHHKKRISRRGWFCSRILYQLG